MWRACWPVHNSDVDLVVVFRLALWRNHILSCRSTLMHKEWWSSRTRTLVTKERQTSMPRVGQQRFAHAHGCVLSAEVTLVASSKLYLSKNLPWPAEKQTRLYLSMFTCISIFRCLRCRSEKLVPLCPSDPSFDRSIHFSLVLPKTATWERVYKSELSSDSWVLHKLSHWTLEPTPHMPQSVTVSEGKNDKVKRAKTLENMNNWHSQTHQRVCFFQRYAFQSKKLDAKDESLRRETLSGQTFLCAWHRMQPKTIWRTLHSAPWLICALWSAEFQISF